MKYDVMVDVETISDDSDSGLVAIGAVKFDKKSFKILDKFFVRISLHDALKYGSVSAETLKWWFKQDKDIINQSFFDGEEFSYQDALDLFSSLFLNDDFGDIWSNPSKFDIVILENAYKQIGRDIPWGRKSIMDLRTLKVASNVDSCYSGKEHDAIDDCISQVLTLQKACEKLNISL